MSYGNRLSTSGHELGSEPMDSLCREGLVSASSPIGYKIVVEGCYVGLDMYQYEC